MHAQLVQRRASDWAAVLTSMARFLFALDAISAAATKVHAWLLHNSACICQSSAAGSNSVHAGCVADGLFC
jgi:hypothetical protein